MSPSCNPWGCQEYRCLSFALSVTTPVSVSPSCNPWGCQEYKFLSFALSVTTPVSVSPFTQSAGMSRGLISVFCFVNHPKLSAICLATPRKSKSTDADIHEQTLVLVLQGTSITGVQNLSDAARTTGAKLFATTASSSC